MPDYVSTIIPGTSTANEYREEKINGESKERNKTKLVAACWYGQSHILYDESVQLMVNRRTTRKRSERRRNNTRADPKIRNKSTINQHGLIRIPLLIVPHYTNTSIRSNKKRTPSYRSTCFTLSYRSKYSARTTFWHASAVDSRFLTSYI